MSRLAIIANPQAHRNRLWPLASQALRKAAPGASFYEARSLADLTRVATEVHAAGHELVAIAGGDGTVQHVVTALDVACEGRLPLLALLGGGAYDSLAAMGGVGDAEQRLKRLSEALASGVPLSGDAARSGREALHIEERDCLRVEGACGFRLGVGLAVRFVEAVYATGNPGAWTGFTTLVRAATSSLLGGAFSRQLYHPLPVEAWVDGEEWPPLPLFGLVCSTVPEAGLGLRPFRRALEQPGFFQVLGLTAGPRAFALELPRLLLGMPARRDRLLDGVAERVELRGAPGLPYLLDGELRTSGASLLVTLGPRLRVVRAA